MKSTESLTWLYNLFNTSNFSTQQNIDYLHSYPQTGIHFHLTRITDFDEKYTLHLVHIMFYHCEDEISYPIMDILIKKCLYNRSFGLKLFFTLKSYRKYLNKEQIGFYRLIIQRVMECDKYRRDKARATVVINFTPIKQQYLTTKEISAMKYQKIETQLSFLKLKDRTSETEIKSEKNNSTSDKVQSSKKNTFQGMSSSLPNKKLKKQGKLRTQRYMLRTRPILNLNRGTGDLSSIFLFFCSAACFFFPHKILDELISYEKMFYTFKAHSIIFPRRLDTTFKGCVNFLDDLVMISFRLKNLPVRIRQRALEIELGYMNQILPAKINLPFSNNLNILNINISFSKTLNSVENVPYILVYECARKIKKEKKEFYNDIYLLRQLYALEKTGNENQSIKDKIIEQLVLDDSSSQNESIEEETTSTFHNTHTSNEIVYKEECSKLKNKMTWAETVNEIKKSSQFSELKPEVKCIIIKTGNELGPEVIASEVLTEMKDIFAEENLRIWVKPYKIYPVYHNAGFVEVISNAKSIHEIKKAHSSISGGKTFLKKFYCEKYQDNLEKAIQNFLESLVGYSLVSYFLGLKDRHNGNILIDDDGHVVHVDFGFVLGLHPGIFCVETAPFKMSAEYIHLLGNRLDEFKKLFIQGFLAMRNNHKKLLRIMEICMNNPKYKFLDFTAIDAFKKRLNTDLSNRELEDFIISLIDWSIKSTTTGLYDSYQYFSNGYMK